MEGLKKLVGILAAIVGVAAVYWLIMSVFNGTLIKDPVQNQIFGWVVLPVACPIILFGLGTFAKYALAGEYEGSHE